MLVRLLRVFMWSALSYAVLTNVVATIWAFTNSIDPWEQIGVWFSPLNSANWRREARLFSPAIAAHFRAGWLSSRT